MNALVSANRRKGRVMLFAILACSLILPGSAMAKDLRLDAAKSRIEFSFSQLGVPMKGNFGKFNALIFFDAKQPAATRATFSVDLNSVDLGAEDYNAESRSPVWLDAKMFPIATFVTDQVRLVGVNKYEALGKLTVKGITQPIKAEFSYLASAQPVVEGGFSMKRLLWRIGDQEWRDTSVVAADVTVRFRFVTTK